MKIPARAPLTKQAQATRVSPGPQVPLRGLAYEVGALGTQPGRSTASPADARTVDYSRVRDSIQSVDAPPSMSERFVTDGHLRLSGRNDASLSRLCHGQTASCQPASSLSSAREGVSLHVPSTVPLADGLRARVEVRRPDTIMASSFRGGMVYRAGREPEFMRILRSA